MLLSSVAVESAARKAWAAGVATTLPGVKHLLILVEKNPNALVAMFNAGFAENGESDEQVRNSKGQFAKGKNKSPLQLRAEWERNTRAGRSRQLTYDICNPDDLSLS